ncbi:uncharacterized protein ISCGN_020167 [Ixodes scapularis]
MAYSHPGSSGQHCVIYDCNNNQRKRKLAADSLCVQHNVQQRECGCNMFLLHRFPADGDLRRQWLSAVNRKGFSPSESSRVCSRHFVDGMRTTENPSPMLALGYNRKVVFGRRRLCRQEGHPPPEKKKKKAPDGAHDNNTQSDTSTSGQAATAGAMQPPGLTETGSLPALATDLAEDTSTCSHAATAGATQPPGLTETGSLPALATDVFEDTSTCSHAATAGTTQPPGLTETGSLPALATDVSEDTSTCRQAATAGTTQPPGLTETGSLPALATDVSEDTSTCGQAATAGTTQPRGLTEIGSLRALATDVSEDTTTCGQAATAGATQPLDLTETCSLPALATDLSEDTSTCGQAATAGATQPPGLTETGSLPALATDVSEDTSTCSHAATAGATQPSGATETGSLPALATDVSNDTSTCDQAALSGATQLADSSTSGCDQPYRPSAMQRPRKLMPRAQTYSSYKAHNTVKFLVAIAPNGYIMHVSDAYGGRASDKLIMRECGINDYLVRGDEVMADRGFTLEPELEVQGIKLNVPAFTKGKAQLSERDVTMTRRIAAVRIHVERAINRMKTYRIFKQSLPIRSKKTISLMIFVIAGLCNLKPPLIRDNETNDSDVLP